MIANHLDDRDLDGIGLPGGLDMHPFRLDGREYQLDRPASPVELLQAARVLAGAVHARTGVTIHDWRDMEPVLVLECAGSPCELAGAAFIAIDGSLIAVETLYRGELARVDAPVAELARRALQLGAASVIAWHCHPRGGDHNPSGPDLQWFADARAKLALLKIDCRDFLTVSGCRVTSCAEHISAERIREPRSQWVDLTDYARLLGRALWCFLLACVRAGWRRFITTTRSNQA